MIFNIRHNLHNDHDDQKGQIYNKLHNIISIFYTNPTYYLESVSINISFVKENKRHYLYVLNTTLHVPTGEDDLRAIVYFIEDNCVAKGIKLQEIDRLFFKITVNKFPDKPQYALAQCACAIVGSTALPPTPLGTSAPVINNSKIYNKNNNDKIY